MGKHSLADVDGAYACRRCGTAWDYPSPLSACPGFVVPTCAADGIPRSPHHFGFDGHCHACGDVDRG